MIQYIYFVKCPECEDEPFDFFDDAKGYALGCLSKKPIITQTEVNRNDFGECTDHCDLGTIWSWENVVGTTEDEPAASVFTKDDLVDYVPDEDPEFDALDNSVNFNIDDVPDNFQNPTATKNKKLVKENFISKYDYNQITKEELYRHLVEQGNTVEIAVGNQSNYGTSFADNGIYSDSILDVEFKDELFSIVMWNYSDDGDLSEDVTYEFNTKSFDELWEELISFKPEALAECTRKAIPEGMTIEQLVEELEENEDVVECKWCEDLFDKSECRYEINLGWLCSRCEAAIKSRGETLTFKENNYWDFLDEDIESDEDVTPTEPKSMLEELEDADEYSKRLTECSECKAKSFDIETGFCINCGFNKDL